MIDFLFTCLEFIVASQPKNKKAVKQSIPLNSFNFNISLIVGNGFKPSPKLSFWCSIFYHRRQTDLIQQSYEWIGI